MHLDCTGRRCQAKIELLASNCSIWQLHIACALRGTESNSCKVVCLQSMSSLVKARVNTPKHLSAESSFQDMIVSWACKVIAFAFRGSCSTHFCCAHMAFTQWCFFSLCMKILDQLQVYRLDLTSNFLTGTLPAQWGAHSLDPLASDIYLDGRVICDTSASFVSEISCNLCRLALVSTNGCLLCTCEMLHALDIVAAQWNRFCAVMTALLASMHTHIVMTKFILGLVLLSFCWQSGMWNYTCVS